jgi:hypothetical protein
VIKPPTRIPTAKENEVFVRFGNWFAGSISVVTKDYCTGNRCIVDVIRCDEEFVLRRDAVRSQVIGALEAQEISIGTYGTVALARIIHEGVSGAEFRVKSVCDLVVGLVGEPDCGLSSAE